MDLVESLVDSFASPTRNNINQSLARRSKEKVISMCLYFSVYFEIGWNYIFIYWRFFFMYIFIDLYIKLYRYIKLAHFSHFLLNDKCAILVKFEDIYVYIYIFIEIYFWSVINKTHFDKWWKNSQGYLVWNTRHSLSIQRLNAFEHSKIECLWAFTQSAFKSSICAIKIRIRYFR